MTNGEYALRGVPISRLVGEHDFISTLWLAWTGTAATPQEKILLEACLVASIDHGVEPPSAHVALRVASCGKPLADSIASGLLTLGPRHGNAASAASAWVWDAVAAGTTVATLVANSMSTGDRLAGLGHKVYQIDPRTTALFTVARHHLATTKHIDLMNETSKALSATLGRAMPVNVDGAIGAIVADMGAPSDLADALFIVGRTVGLVAHAREEAAGSDSYKRE